MRTQTISTTSITWRDERRGRATVADADQLQTLLAHFAIDAPPTLPVDAENASYHIHTRGDTFPCRATVDRKPQSPLQQAAWTYCVETRMARIVERDGQLGMFFLDEETFIPFSKLAHDPPSGFSIID